MLKIHELRKNYGDFSLDCSLKVEPGRVTGLVGQNGAGKSSTFKAVLGLITRDGGRISLLGKPPEAFTPGDRERLGVVLPGSGFSGYLSIRDIVPVLAAMYKSFDRAFFTARADRLQLPWDLKIKDFSTGMKARLKLLTALSHGADFLILDEPTAGLDVLARDELLEMLREFMEEDDRRSILISSHISGDLESLCDDIYMIHRGRIVLHQDTDLLLDSYALLKLSREQYRQLDRRYILRVKDESYGLCCLTDQKQFYLENYPGLALERGGIDNVMTMMIRGRAQ